MHFHCHLAFFFSISISFGRSFLTLTNFSPAAAPRLPFTTTPQGHTKLPDYVYVGPFPRTPLRDLFTAASGDALNLLSKCIIYEPRRRISARDVRIFKFRLSFFSFPFSSLACGSARRWLLFLF
jgi:hypothetical protein